MNLTLKKNYHFLIQLRKSGLESEEWMDVNLSRIKATMSWQVSLRFLSSGWSRLQIWVLTSKHEIRSAKWKCTKLQNKIHNCFSWTFLTKMWWLCFMKSKCFSFLLPGLCEVMTSASCCSGTVSCLLLSSSWSLSTMAMTQLRHLATLAHTLSWESNTQSAVRSA